MKRGRPGKFPGRKPRVLTRQAIPDSTGQLTRAPLYVTRPLAQFGRVDLPVNVALLALVVSVAPLTEFVEPTYLKPFAQQPDLSPNIAVRVAAPELPAGEFIEPVYVRKPAQQPDIAPNIAVNLQTVKALPPGEPTHIRPRWLEPDLYPNITLRLQAGSGEPVIEPTYTARPLYQPDVYPNLAVHSVVVVTPAPSPAEPWIIERRWQPPDLYPNLAVRFVAPAVPIAPPVEPWYIKPYPPQVDVYQNTAIYAPADSVGGIPAPIEPTYALQLKIGSSLDPLPNIAVNFDNIPPPVVDSPPLGPWGPGPGDDTPKYVRSMFDASHRPPRKPKKLPEIEIRPPVAEEPLPPPKPLPEPAILTSSLADLLDLQTRVALSAAKVELVAKAKREAEEQDQVVALLAAWLMMDD